MPELDELLRAAADGAVTRTKPADFEAVVRGARRRRALPAAVGAGALAACVIIGTVVVAGGRDPAPAPPSITAVAERDPELAPLLVEIPVITWTPDPGRSPAGVVGHVFDDAVGGAGYAAGNTTGEDSRFSLDPQLEEAGITGPWVIPSYVDSRAELRTIAARLREVPGIQDAQVTTVRGMRFTVTVRARLRADEKEGGNVLIGQSGITWGASNFKPRAGGIRDWTMNAYYLGAPLDRAALDRIKSLAANAWRIRPDQVIVTPQPLRD
ncbi:hypothetical protein [Actinoplanes sp. NPDC049265]|uniref:hypothetical protein n=1 Tax=Actinoplanes sp. NPDC049265 TaxID=3363902 RepID=UPI003720FD34